MREVGHSIDGKEVFSASRRKFVSINPATEEPLAEAVDHDCRVSRFRLMGK